MSDLLRDLLVAAGVRPGDLREAVSESRRVVGKVESWSGIAERAAQHLREKSKREKVQKMAGLAELAAGFVRGKAGEMLGRGRR